MFKFPTHPALAVDIGTTYPPAQKGFTSVGFLVNTILPNILTVAGVVTLIFVVIAGIKIIADAGSGQADKAAKDKGAFTAALIGLIIIFGAYLFVTQIVSTLIGWDVLNPGF